MNLRKWGYFYLPLTAAALGVAAILIDVIYSNPLKPTVFVLIAVMGFLIYLGKRTATKQKK
ncbi:MAG: Flp pilus assembly protein TadB [Spirosomataceae bacterium]|jgi:Flp pilus assembly protein TadB